MKNKFIYAILAVIVSILVLVVPAIHPTRHCRKAGVHNATMRTMREYLALNPATVSVQELEQKRQAAYNAAAQMPNRLRMKHQAHIAQKSEQSNYKELIRLAARTGQTADELRTVAGHDAAYKNIQQLLAHIGNENNAIVKQIKDKQYDQISFKSVLVQAEQAATAIDAFGRIYNNDAAYGALTARLETVLKPALAKNGLTFITDELKKACPDITPQMKPLSELTTTIRPHAIDRLKASGVLAIGKIMNTQDEARYGNALLQARTAATQLYEILNMILGKLGVTMQQQANTQLTAQYQQVYQSYFNTVQEFINLVATPLRLIYQDASQQILIHADTLKHTIAQQRNQIRASQRTLKTVQQPVVQQTQNPQDNDNDQDDAKEDAQPATTASSKRDLIGAVGALGLVLLYEFVIAPKMNTKKLGIAEFCKAVMNKQNPLTTKLDGQPAVANNDDEQQQAGPGFLKRFGFDIFCSFFGL